MTDSKEDGLAISVEREDLEDGSITYHLWDTTNGGYKWIVGLNDDKLAQGGKSKFYAERIALAVNALSASSPPVGGSGEVVTESTRLAAEQILVLHPHLPPLAAHLIKRVSQLPTALAAPVPNGVPEGGKLPDDNDGIEQDAFEEWAASERYDMEQHPLFYIFMDSKTNAARNGWRAGIRHARDRYRAMLAVSPVTPEGLSGGDADA